MRKWTSIDYTGYTLIPAHAFIFLRNKKNKSLFDVRVFMILIHFPKFQQKIFIIVDEKWMKHNFIAHMVTILGITCP